MAAAHIPSYRFDELVPLFQYGQTTTFLGRVVIEDIPEELKIHEWRESDELFPVLRKVFNAALAPRFLAASSIESRGDGGYWRVRTIGEAPDSRLEFILDEPIDVTCNLAVHSAEDFRADLAKGLRLEVGDRYLAILPEDREIPLREDRRTINRIFSDLFDLPSISIKGPDESRPEIDVQWGQHEGRKYAILTPCDVGIIIKK